MVISSKNEQNNYDPKLDQSYNHGLKAIKVLTDAGFQARFAGGCVRDRLLGIRPKDYDVATNAKPDDVCLIFKQKNIKTVPTGIDHGTITIVLGGVGLEVTSLRKDVATDGRRAVVAFGESFEEDSERRDFTINALFEDAEGQIYDYHSGQTDLQNRILRFVGDPATRIQEDYLRILRLFRFWARYDGFSPADGTLEAVAKEARGLEQISAERITSELMLTLESEGAPRVLPALYQTGVMKVALGLEHPPSVSISALTLYKKTETGIARLAAILWDLPNFDAKKRTLERLRLSRQQKDKVLLLLNEDLPSKPSDPAEVFDWLDKAEAKAGEGSWSELIFPSWAVICDQPALREMNETIKSNISRRVVQIDANDLMQKLGISPGPDLGTLISQLRGDYRKGLWTTPDECLRRARQIFKASGSSSS